MTGLKSSDIYIVTSVHKYIVHTLALERGRSPCSDKLFCSGYSFDQVRDVVVAYISNFVRSSWTIILRRSRWAAEK